MLPALALTRRATVTHDAIATVIRPLLPVAGALTRRMVCAVMAPGAA